ncbi:actinodefensin-associated protein B [Streptomyces sp. AK04-3B]|uniref:actinodefensin-associated protein B n=1 Tax=Streptomyces sp. AK04-3B TaxID=3028650 RepID=UPI0029B8E826|nr:actinodefensin-associated protein B [Streptomyces sp. AK04-3B]MDX3798909.1 actinodefensin-associated protein B [Streptomyces sp. AK04-3B]
MTPEVPPAAGAALALAPHVTLTFLPFGGAVLANGRTLAVLDFRQREAALLERLLQQGMPPTEAGPWPARVAGRLIAAGWLVTDRSE